MNHLFLDPRVQVPPISPCAGRIFDEVADKFPGAAARYLEHAFGRLRDTVVSTETQPIDPVLVAEIVGPEAKAVEEDTDVLVCDSTYFTGPVEGLIFPSHSKPRPWMNRIRGALRKVEHLLVKAQLIYRGEV